MRWGVTAAGGSCVCPCSPWGEGGAQGSAPTTLRLAWRSIWGTGVEEPPFHLQSHQSRWKNRASGGKLRGRARPGSRGTNLGSALTSRDPPGRARGRFRRDEGTGGTSTHPRRVTVLGPVSPTAVVTGLSLWRYRSRGSRGVPSVAGTLVGVPRGCRNQVNSSSCLWRRCQPWAGDGGLGWSCPPVVSVWEGLGGRKSMRTPGCGVRWVLPGSPTVSDQFPY